MKKQYLSDLSLRQLMEAIYDPKAKKKSEPVNRRGLQQEFAAIAEANSGSEDREITRPIIEAFSKNDSTNEVLGELKTILGEEFDSPLENREIAKTLMQAFPKALAKELYSEQTQLKAQTDLLKLFKNVIANLKSCLTLAIDRSGNRRSVLDRVDLRKAA